MCLLNYWSWQLQNMQDWGPIFLMWCWYFPILIKVFYISKHFPAPHFGLAQQCLKNWARVSSISTLNLKWKTNPKLLFIKVLKITHYETFCIVKSIKKQIIVQERWWRAGHRTLQEDGLYLMRARTLARRSVFWNRARTNCLASSGVNSWARGPLPCAHRSWMSCKLAPRTTMSSLNFPHSTIYRSASPGSGSSSPSTWRKPNHSSAALHRQPLSHWQIPHIIY